MAHEPNLIDIYSASWGRSSRADGGALWTNRIVRLGPVDDGKTVDGPRHATMKAIVKGINEVLEYVQINQG